MNEQFNKTYKRFLHVLTHQPADQANNLVLSKKHQLQVVYYLQLQDRIEEAIEIFSKVDRSDSNVLQDYLLAYFDFFVPSNIDQFQFVNASEMARRYADYPIEHFRLMFLKIKEQLDEVSEAKTQLSGRI